jgi:hypothetical protein
MSMTHEEAARILDPETSRETLDEIEYYGGFRGDEAVLEAVNEACRIAADVLRNKQTGEALTIEQLRKMDGQPVWVKVIGKTGIRCDGWCEVEIREKDPFAYVWWPGSEVEDIAKIEDYEKDWVAYAYPPVHIDREAWEPCIKCNGKCYFCKFNETSKCGNCKNHESYSPMFNFCPDCGRPLTEEA